MPAGEGAVGIPEQLGVVVGVQVDEARRDMQAAGVDDAARVRAVEMADLGDHPVLDGDVGSIARGPRAVEDEPILDYQVISRHRAFPVIRYEGLILLRKYRSAIRGCP